jgi:hypothetical protein
MKNQIASKVATVGDGMERIKTQTRDGLLVVTGLLRCSLRDK